MGDLGMDEDRPLPSFAAPLNNPDPDSVRVEAWVLAEDQARDVLNYIHPTLDSEEKRKDVIEFVQKLIRCNLRLEVFPYGSVPLKTYLPDGDIDLTVLSTPNLDEILPREVLRVLQEQEQNGNTEFELKDTQFIDAEVKLVKCLVQDIVIDISFNQLGGLCTLCFLEQVDRLAGKDHLFKRSIILIKAWCYYESRILGAHHGLISTYALETLVLYIFHVFHASLNGPIEVLYRFLDYYAKSDWDNYCISLDGPVCKASLPNLAMENAENEGGNDVLLGAEFRKNCMDMFIVPSKGVEPDPRVFPLKNLNIIDPLKENNNLGRSVNRGNYYRIRSAFRYGARRLGKILQLPNNNIGDEIKMFFRNTLQRHRPKYVPDNPFVNGLKDLSISSRSEPCYEDDFDEYMTDSSITETNNNNLGLKNDQNTPLHNSDPVDGKTGLRLWMERGSELVDGDTICVCINNKENDNILSENDESIGESEMLNPFSDLTGDYDGHIRNLLYGQGCHGYALSTNMVRASPSPPTSPYGNGSPWDPVARSWSQVNANGAVVGPGHNGYVNGNNRASGHAAVRGTGPYIPVMNCNTCKERAGPTRGGGRGRGARLQPLSNGHHNQRAPKLVVEGSTQIPQEWSPKQAPRLTQPNPTLVNSTVNGNGNAPNQTHKNPSPVNSTTNGNVLVNQTHKNPDPVNSPTNGNVVNQTHKNPNPVNSATNGNVVNQTHKNPNPVNSPTNGNVVVNQTHTPVNSPTYGNVVNQNHNPVNSATNGTGNGNGTHSRKLEFGSFRSVPNVVSNTEVKSPKLDVNGRKQGRNGDNSFHLKNEEEFPPLSSA